MKEERVAVFVDGFNFYRGMREMKWKKYYWLDMVRLFEQFMLPGQRLVAVNYFSARPHANSRVYGEKRKRQRKFFLANAKNDRFHLFLGNYVRKTAICRACGAENFTFEEKKTDVRIATEMVIGCVRDTYDVGILVSADSDLVPPVEFLRFHPHRKRIGIFFPPKRYSTELVKAAHFYMHLANFEARFRKARFPARVFLGKGQHILCPPVWR